MNLNTKKRNTMWRNNFEWEYRWVVNQTLQLIEESNGNADVLDAYVELYTLQFRVYNRAVVKAAMYEIIKVMKEVDGDLSQLETFITLKILNNDLPSVYSCFHENFI